MTICTIPLHQTTVPCEPRKIGENDHHIINAIGRSDFWRYVTYILTQFRSCIALQEAVEAQLDREVDQTCL